VVLKETRTARALSIVGCVKVHLLTIIGTKWFDLGHGLTAVQTTKSNTSPAEYKQNKDFSKDFV